ncbi:hypothetical protein TcasGA2_TC010551 [Tribolium castaneum]|uniref:Uncharacterized protein n=1 Tax=Tribolium castaneum TaxID=7070 RepID=D6WE27_TRICA|nr:PREDICTED: uncharacterized protein LOC103314600 [Tribolium castaneum]EFA01224.2 hypothetical protein TcasGA2_TC010551 [Tribolium castaneum]|eukprot:XP_008199262.1 PREDICTED: uncharacterized protein LOC103314600 [Tribolium castaneum]
MKTFVLFIVIALTLTSNAQIPIGVSYRCFGQICPPTTVLCQRRQYTTANDTLLTTEVDCLDDTLTTVNSYNNSRPNPFGADWSFQGLTVANVVVVYQKNVTTTTITPSSPSTPRTTSTTTRRSTTSRTTTRS